MNKINGKNKSRSSKTTRNQYEIYLDELNTNKFFRENKFDGSDPEIIQNTWAKLTEKLNSLGGPIRDIAGWKRVFTDWKCQTRAKARKCKEAMKETGNRGDGPKKLNDLEQKLLDITGWVVVNGMENVPEIGIDGNANKNRGVEQDEQENVTEQYVQENAAEKDIQENAAKNKAEPKEMVNKSDVRLVKKRSLTSCLQAMMNHANSTEKNENNEVLREICKNVEEINSTQKKRLKLRQLELELKYPEYKFVIDSDSELLQSE